MIAGVSKYEAQLSFVANGSFWAVSPTGDNTEDNRKGAEYAQELIDFLANNPESMPLLGRVVQDIISHGKYDGITVGFFHRLSAEIRRGK